MVWVVIDCDQSPGKVLAVFSNEEAADKYCDVHPNAGWDCFELLDEVML